MIMAFEADEWLRAAGHPHPGMTVGNGLEDKVITKHGTASYAFADTIYLFCLMKLFHVLG